MLSTKSVFGVQQLLNLSGAYTTQVRCMARKIVRKKKNNRSMEGSIEKAAPKKVWPSPIATPVHSESAISSTHLNIANPGFQGALKGRKMVVYGLNQFEKKQEITSTNEARYMYGFGNPNRPNIIQAYPRVTAGKAVSTELRKTGYIPCSISHQQDFTKTLNIFVDPLTIEPLVRADGTYSAVHHVEVKGYSERFRCLVRNWEIDPVSRKTVHVQFMLVEPNRKYKQKISVALEGESESLGVKHGGVILQPTYQMTCIHDPALGSRVGHIEPPPVVTIDIIDRGLNTTFHGYDIPKPFYLEMPDNQKWKDHVFFTFTKKLG